MGVTPTPEGTVHNQPCGQKAAKFRVQKRLGRVAHNELTVGECS